MGYYDANLIVSFLQGRYTADIWIGDGSAEVDALMGYLNFEIEEADVYGSGRLPFHYMGVVFLEPDWEFKQGGIE